MSIDFNKFLQWAESRFGDVVVKGEEIMINSIYVEDYKHHLSCNPSGGKKKFPNGVYKCWKSFESNPQATGSLVSLVMQVDNCSYDEALDRLGAIDVSLRSLERKLEQFFSDQEKQKIDQTPDNPGLALPENTSWITDLPEGSFWREEAEYYLNNRKLPPSDYMICTGGDCKNRVIIPYYDQNQKLIYWNGRFLEESKNISKYRGPHKDCGVGKGDVIYMPDGWPPAGSKIYITEGEFDSKSISISGLFSCAIGGKSIEEKQIEMLRPYIPVLCFDTDDKAIDAGGNALLHIGNKLKSKGFSEVYYVRPPKQFKDWNKMLVDVGPKVINVYIKQNIKQYSNSTSLELTLKRI